MDAEIVDSDTLGLSQDGNGNGVPDECEERVYSEGRLDGQATVIYPDSAKEIRQYTVSLDNFLKDYNLVILIVPLGFGKKKM